MTTDMQARQTLVDGLVGLMRLERLETDLFRGERTHEPWTRVFGGQVIGQALMAACQTVEGRLPHSLHGYFLRAGDPALPIVYQVSRDRDGKSFSSRRVVAIQHGQKLLNLACSFQVVEPGLSHQAAMPEVPPPERLEDSRTLLLRAIDQVAPARRPLLAIHRPVEFRPIDGDGRPGQTKGQDGPAYWFRAVAPLPDDATLHRVLLAYSSDMMLLAASLRPHGMSWLDGRIQEASLDHAVWFHRDVRIDDWLLYVQDSPWSGGARGLNRGLIFRRDGTLVASIAQEGLIRLREPRSAGQPPGAAGA